MMQIEKWWLAALACGDADTACFAVTVGSGGKAEESGGQCAKGDCDCSCHIRVLLLLGLHIALVVAGYES